MNILALDTTGRDCAVALRRMGQADQIICEPIGRGHAERLAPMVSEILEQAGLEAGNIDRIGVTIGPGSFAGTRVGVAFARGLALSANATAFGISNLAIWAAAQDARPLAVLHDAKRGEVILQVWQDDAPEASERLSVEEARSRLAGLTLTGPGAVLYGGEAALSLDLSRLLDLTATADPAQSPPSPFYARPPDAKLPGGIDP